MLEWLRRGDMDEAVTRAALYAFKGPMTARGANKKGWQTLKRPDVCQAVEQVFAQEGFSFADIVKQHIEHIKGGIETVEEKTVSGPEGTTHTTIRKKTLPNYAALRDLERMIIPNQPQKFEFANTTKRHIGGVLGGEGAPEVETDEYPAPRVIGPARVTEEVQTDETDEAQDAQTKD